MPERAGRRGSIRLGRKLVIVAGLGLASLVGCRWDDTGAFVPENEVAVRLEFTCESGTCRCNGAVLDLGVCSEFTSQWIDAAHASGLVYQRACTEKLFELAYGHFGSEEDPCAPDAATYAWASCENECQVFSGTSALGEPCTSVGRRMSNCAPELLCAVDGLCHEPCDRPMTIPEGRPCGYFANGYLDETCALGFVCDPATSVCVAASSPGTPCEPAASTCSTDAWCDPIGGQCVAKLPDAAPCDDHDQCVSQVCDGVCLTRDPYLCLHPYF